MCVLQSDMRELLLLTERSHSLNYAAKILRPGPSSQFIIHFYLLLLRTTVL